MQISPDQGQFMALLVKLLDARIIVEVGTYTGYSALAMAGALPGDGRLIACDISREWTNIGLPFWEQAGVRDKIDLRIAPALDTLDQLLEQGLAGKVDLVFIDADKTSYVNYYDRAYRLLRPNGLILIDNVFWSGAVADPDITDEDTIAIRRLNDLVSRDDRVDISMISVGDGLFLARKK
jgi:caffeoyl-CoA O-methyltransferase